MEQGDGEGRHSQPERGEGEEDMLHFKLLGNKVPVHITQEMGRNTWSHGTPGLPSPTGQVHPNPFWYHGQAGLCRY